MESLERSSELTKFQPITLNDGDMNESNPVEELSVEDKILYDYRDYGRIIWHTHNKSVEFDEMDLDFKVLASIHCLKVANKLNEKLSNGEHDPLNNSRMIDFMNIFVEIEENLEQEHDIDLPETVEEIQNLRQELKNA